MVDLKKINIPKVKVDPKKVMGLIDGLVEKIPPQVQDLIKKAALTIFAFLMLFGIYTGWSDGWESAKPQGLQLAQDTRSLFLEEIERDYNRRRKDVQMTTPEENDFATQRKMEFEFTQDREGQISKQNLIPEESELLGKELNFRNKKSDAALPPLATPNGDGLISSPIDMEMIGTYQNQKELSENPDAEPKLLPRINESKKNLIPALPEEDEAEEKKFRAMVERLDLLEKKLAEKKKKESEKTVPLPETNSKPRRELERPR